MKTVNNKDIDIVMHECDKEPEFIIAVSNGNMYSKYVTICNIFYRIVFDIFLLFLNTSMFVILCNKLKIISNY